LEKATASVGPGAVFDVLDDVAAPNRTQWSIVYDQTELHVHFRTLRSRGLRSIRLPDLDFSCALPAQMIDVDLKAKGDLADRWSNYTREANRDLIGRSYAKTGFLKDVPLEVLDALAAYPDRARCGK
jgi:hypothetical protein